MGKKKNIGSGLQKENHYFANSEQAEKTCNAPRSEEDGGDTHSD